MAFKTDGGGFAFKSSNIKISLGTSTWGMKLSQLSKMRGTVRIITYSLPNTEYIREQFDRRPHNIFLICHEKFIDRATEVAHLYPAISVAVCSDVHSKLCLIEPETLWIGSANFGRSGWHETTVGIKSTEAHDYGVDEFRKLWTSSRKIITKEDGMVKLSGRFQIPRLEEGLWR